MGGFTRKLIPPEKYRVGFYVYFWTANFTRLSFLHQHGDLLAAERAANAEIAHGSRGPKEAPGNAACLPQINNIQKTSSTNRLMPNRRGGRAGDEVVALAFVPAGFDTTYRGRSEQGTVGNFAKLAGSA
jgi:hypothetical protein